MGRVAELVDGAWEGQSCLIVGGGASAARFSWLHFEPTDRVIVASRAGDEVTRQVDLWVSADRPFWESRKLRLDQSMRVWVHPPGDAPLKPGCADISIPWFKHQWNWEPPESLKDGVACCGNSGHAALCLAYLLGADPIYLLGFDCEPGTWTTAKGRPPKQQAFDRWMAGALKLAALAAENGRRVRWVGSGAGCDREELYRG